jgi:hypothetical protein
VASDLSNNGPRGTRPLRVRPHWWAVLAVSLSLLALVAAATSGHQGPDHHRSAAAPSEGTHATSPTTSTPASTTTTVPGLGSGSASVTPPTPTEVIAPVAPTFAGGTKAQVVTRQSTAPTGTSAGTPTPTTTTTAPPSGSTVATAPAPPTPFITTGDLAYPDDSTASFPFAGAGAMRVTVTWQTTPTLSLTVTDCGATQTAQGSSPLTVLLPDADGTCLVTLKELLVQYDMVTYKLTAGPAGG